jgi:hypothetical protein
MSSASDFTFSFSKSGEDMTPKSTTEVKNPDTGFFSVPEKKKTASRKRSSKAFFDKPDPTPSEVHPYAETDYFEFNPPIPEFNYIIDPVTLEILEDLTGQP